MSGSVQGSAAHATALVIAALAPQGRLGGLDSASNRLRSFMDKAAQATLVGDVFDDAATGQGLLNYFLRAINCGAMTQDECEQKTGLTKTELRSRSFVKILDVRRKR